ncbi:MAG: hypothetical protein ACYCSG_00985 [Thermoplasmataceae archaeon]
MPEYAIRVDVYGIYANDGWVGSLLSIKSIKRCAISTGAEQEFSDPQKLIMLLLWGIKGRIHARIKFRKYAF